MVEMMPILRVTSVDVAHDISKRNEPHADKYEQTLLVTQLLRHCEAGGERKVSYL